MHAALTTSPHVQIAHRARPQAAQRRLATPQRQPTPVECGVLRAGRHSPSGGCQRPRPDPQPHPPAPPSAQHSPARPRNVQPWWGLLADSGVVANLLGLAPHSKPPADSPTSPLCTGVAQHGALARARPGLIHGKPRRTARLRSPPTHATSTRSPPPALPPAQKPSVPPPSVCSGPKQNLWPPGPQIWLVSTATPTPQSFLAVLARRGLPILQLSPPIPAAPSTPRDLS